MKPATLWPLAVIGALAITVVANIVLLVEASDPRKSGIEPDYYRKAVAWDSTMAERDRSAALGWRLQARLTPDSGGAVLRAEIADREGAAVSGASVRVEAIHNLDPERPEHALLPETREGEYEGTLPLFHRGLWELRFVVTRGSDRFAASLRRDREGGP